MKNIHWLILAFVLFRPAGLRADDQKTETNVNARYEVESVEVTGIPDSRISGSLRAEMKRLVGEKYDREAANALARRLHEELPNYSISVKALRGDKPEHLKLVFEAARNWWKRFDIPIPPVVYTSKEGWSGSIDLPLSSGPNIFTFGLVDSADVLLERNAGFRLRYENRKVGTDRIQMRFDFDSYHQMWNAATESALAQAPDIPGIYRSRQNFAPSVAVIAFRDLKLSAGASFQRLETQYPSKHTDTAYAGTAEIQYRHNWENAGGIRQRVKGGYSLRSATRVLDSDFVYTRHSFSADYTLSKGKNSFGAHFQGGVETGKAPLFERFSLGDSFTLRGWNKFDVAPLGGNRAAHGSLEYRYRPYQIFYDVGAVWDSGRSARVRHALGFGLAFKDGAFISLAFPVRLNHVAPVFMLGFRY